MSYEPVLGVFGGMGPLAGVDFCRQLIIECDADGDADHLPFVLWSDPSIPPRPEYLAGISDIDPAEHLIAAVKGLAATGVKAIVIPCNTAHWWVQQLEDAAGVPILHIADAAIGELPDQGAEVVAVLGTPATLSANIYQDRLAAAGRKAIVPDEETVATHIMHAIYEVKRNRLDPARDIFSTVIEQQRERGANAVIMGCSEIPLAMAGQVVAGMTLIDPNAALARKSLAWCRENGYWASGANEVNVAHNKK